MQSLGGKFIELQLDTASAETKGGYAQEMGEEFYRKQREMLIPSCRRKRRRHHDSRHPGQESPLLVLAAGVAKMAPGSVIVDLAAERGGNCELTKAGETVVEHGVTILGPLNLPSEIPQHASQMYAKNITTFLLNLVKDKQLQINLEDEIIRDTLICRDGQVVNSRIQQLLRIECQAATGGRGSWRDRWSRLYKTSRVRETHHRNTREIRMVRFTHRLRRKEQRTMSLSVLALLAATPPEAAPKADFLTLLYVLMLATFTGLLVIRNVSRLLHTPLDVAYQRHFGHRRGGIDRAGRQPGVGLYHGSRHGGGDCLDDEHRQRLPADRSDAQDVQEAGACQVMNMDTVIQPIYLVSAILFILSLMWMNHPSTARRGMFSGVVAMLAAIGGTILLPEIHSYNWIVIAIVIGCILGVPLAMVPLTAVPQRTALSHAFGGLAAGLVGASEYYLVGPRHPPRAAVRVRHRRPGG